MRKLTYYIASTIDGFIAGPDGGDPSVGEPMFLMEGDHMAALTAEYPETLPGHFRTAFGVTAPNRHFDTVLMGLATYRIGLDAGIPSPYPHLRQYVFSRSITERPDPAVEVVATEPVDTVRRLKAEDGLGIWLCGGGQLAGVLRDEIDELLVKLHPVVAGAGIPLFAGGFDPRRYALTNTRVFDSGVQFLTYARA